MLEYLIRKINFEQSIYCASNHFGCLLKNTIDHSITYVNFDFFARILTINFDKKILIEFSPAYTSFRIIILKFYLLKEFINDLNTKIMLHLII